MPRNGTIDTSVPVLMSCIAFGLSMDDEVFLLSRIKEEHDRRVGLREGARLAEFEAVPEPSGT